MKLEKLKNLLQRFGAASGLCAPPYTVTDIEKIVQDNADPCPRSPTGFHAIPRGPPFDQKSWEEWRKLSEQEKIRSGVCIYCGVAIW